MSRKHIVITGTGRSGTTFLVQLLTQLGLETGFDLQEMESMNYDQNARAGLEYDIRQEGCPYVVKSPWFCDYAMEVLSRDDIRVEHVFVPIRDLYGAAESRRYVVRSDISKASLLRRVKKKLKPSGAAGGLWHTNSLKPGRQERVLAGKLYELMFALSDTMIPVTLMRYPKIVRDSSYLFRKLKPVLGEICYKDFEISFRKSVRPDFVHSFNDTDYYINILG